MPSATLTGRNAATRYAVAAAVGVVVLAVSATAVVMAWQRWPGVARTVTSLVVAGMAGAIVGLRVGARERSALRVRLQDAERRTDAWRLGDTRTDLDVVGPVTGETPVVLYDQDAEPERCDNCGDLAVYAVDEGDGNYCSYACEVCIELWMPDGFDPTIAKRINVGSTT